MARPKLNKAKKKALNLTVSDQTKLELQYISQHHNESISVLIADWASKEARRIAKATGTQLPDVAQLTLDDLTDQGE